MVLHVFACVIKLPSLISLTSGTLRTLASDWSKSLNLNVRPLLGVHKLKTAVSNSCWRSERTRGYFGSSEWTHVISITPVAWQTNSSISRHIDNQIKREATNMSKDEKESIIPDVIYDVNSGKSFIKGRFFGKVSTRFFFLLPQRPQTSTTFTCSWLFFSTHHFFLVNTLKIFPFIFTRE